jgi:hypothetical protein
MKDINELPSLPDGLQSVYVALVAGSYYELRINGHRRLSKAGGIKYTADFEGFAPSFTKAKVSKKKVSRNRKLTKGRRRAHKI